jgi:N-acyl homoserine lactone hydrolase
MRLTFALVASLASLTLFGCTASDHATRPSDLGKASSSDQLIASLAAPGTVKLETVTSANWAVTRAGLINLDHPKAKAAGLTDGDEPIQVFFHVLRHPTKGTFIVDSGVEHAQKASPDTAAVRGIVASYMKTEQMDVPNDLASWLAKESAPLAGVFLTHLHLDHVMGLPDVPRGTAIYAGPGETTPRAFTNFLVKPSIDRALEGHVAIQEWTYAADPAGRVDGLVDIFGDGSAWAIWMPGHTPGNTAYLVNTPEGPVLLTGDTCHTLWGWDNDVEPGTFSGDKAQSALSMAKLKQLAALHPRMDVRVGHQSRAKPEAGPSSAAQR